MGFSQYPPPVTSGSVGAVTSTTPISGNPPNLDTLGEMALAISSNSANIGALATQVGNLGTQFATLPPASDIMLRSEYDVDNNTIVDVVDVVNGGVI